MIHLSRNTNVYKPNLVIASIFIEGRKNEPTDYLGK